MSTPAASPVPEPVAAIATTEATAPADADASNTCRYPSKKCWNARALKRNGEMHNLCDEHRQKANKNQRRLEQKRKTSKKVVATKRTRKSRALKNKAVYAAGQASKQLTKRQQQQQQSTLVAPTTAAATELVAAAHSLQSQQQQTMPVRLNPSLPAGFFTDLMMSETLYTKQQMELSLLPPHPRVPSVTDFLDGDLDSLTDCLTDYSMTPLFANNLSSNSIGCGMTLLGNGSSSPIDVCDGLDAVAAVNDFWWHPVVVVDPLLDTSALTVSDEIFAFSQH